MARKFSDFWQVLKNRHCVRDFDSQKPIAKKDLKRILSAGHTAPTAGGLHPEKFVVIEDEATKQRLAKASLSQEFLADAPVVVIICADKDISGSKYGRRGRELYAIQDTAAAVQNMFLAATALGICACWVGGFREEKVAEILQLPSHIRPLVIFPLGYKLED